MRFLIISPRSGDDGSRLSLAALWLLGKGQRQTFVLSVFSQVSRPHFLFLAPFIFFFWSGLSYWVGNISGRRL